MKMFGQCTIRLLTCLEKCEKCFSFISLLFLFLFCFCFVFFSFSIFLFVLFFFSVLSDLEVNQPAFPV